MDFKMEEHWFLIENRPLALGIHRGGWIRRRELQWEGELKRILGGVQHVFLIFKLRLVVAFALFTCIWIDRPMCILFTHKHMQFQAQSKLLCDSDQKTQAEGMMN